MPAKTVAYALTSDGRDEYCCMTLLSAISVRLSNPSIRLVVCCDINTAANLKKRSSQLLDEIDALITIDVGTLRGNFANRFVKTSVRLAVAGPVLYLDGDTLVRGSLESAFLPGVDVAGAANHNGADLAAQFPDEERGVFNRHAWSPPHDLYFNGGVIYMADSQGALRFSQIWHSKWLEHSQLTGSYRDQPSLNSALKDSQIHVARMDNSLNAQIDVRPQAAWGAKVWHFYNSNGAIKTRTHFDALILRTAKRRVISHRDVLSLSRKTHPWIVRNPIDLVCVRNFQTQAAFLKAGEFERLWMSGERRSAFAHLWQAVRDGLRNRVLSTRRIFRGFARTTVTSWRKRA